jgi:hypothetical protein
MLSLERVGSFCNAPSICDFRLLASAVEAFTSLWGSPLALDPSAAVVEAAVPVVPAVVLGVVADAVEDGVALPAMLPLVLGGVLAVAEVEPTLLEALAAGVPEAAGVEAVAEVDGVLAVEVEGDAVALASVPVPTLGAEALVVAEAAGVEAVAEAEGVLLPVEAVAEGDGALVVVVVVVVEAVGVALCPETPVLLPAEAVVPEPAAPPAIFSTLT